MSRPLIWGLLALFSCTTGCLHPRIGPTSIPRDRVDYIDDDDLPSKAVFAQLMELFTMIDTSNKQNLPVVTIPAR